MQKKNDDIAKMAFEWNPAGSRKQAGPRITWIPSVHNESEWRGSWTEISRLVHDREKWKEFFSALCFELE